jgi:hypothetical protein
VPPPPGSEAQRPEPPDLRDAVQTALVAMTWLKPSDAALRALALRIAHEIEEAVDRTREFEALRRHPEIVGDVSAFKRLQALQAMCDATKTVGWLGPQLQGFLKDLGGNPVARAAMKSDKPIGGRLAQLRQAAAGDQSAGKDDS